MMPAKQHALGARRPQPQALPPRCADWLQSHGCHLAHAHHWEHRPSCVQSRVMLRVLLRKLPSRPQARCAEEHAASHAQSRASQGQAGLSRCKEGRLKHWLWLCERTSGCTPCARARLLLLAQWPPLHEQGEGCRRKLGDSCGAPLGERIQRPLPKALPRRCRRRGGLLRAMAALCGSSVPWLRERVQRDPDHRTWTR